MIPPHLKTTQALEIIIYLEVMYHIPVISSPNHKKLRVFFLKIWSWDGKEEDEEKMYTFF